MGSLRMSIHAGFRRFRINPYKRIPLEHPAQPLPFMMKTARPMIFAITDTPRIRGFNKPQSQDLTTFK
jgi:hypothetical protein